MGEGRGQMADNDQDGRSKPRSMWKEVGVVAALIGAAGVIAAAVIQGGLPLLKDGPEGGETAGPTATASGPAAPVGAPSTPSAETKYLSEMEPTSPDSDPTEDSVTLNGNVYTNSLRLDVGGCNERASVTYALNREWRAFHAVVGVTGDSQPDTEVYYKFFVDNQQVGPEWKTSKFKSETVDFDVSSKQELELRMSFVKGDMGICSNAGHAAWGEASLTR
ncbi:NPCBM/NEW2 domain-containing protein [Spirillospora sp. NPDC048819]|uniref:NPCBM/NEW2 domain-containing protein n=1 Tax=Spirillospora sp. NPDC048819 TaxID=3155268 RepID=UPI0033F29A28